MPQIKRPDISGTLSTPSLSGSVRNAGVSASLNVPHTILETDYNRLVNKPTINGVEISGDKNSQDYNIVSENTTSGWNENPMYLPKRGEICVYTDYVTQEDDMGNTIVYPGFKIGDGNSYLIDMPFVGAEIRYEILRQLQAHTSNTAIHITQSEREFWNNKLNYEYDESEEILILNRN